MFYEYLLTAFKVVVGLITTTRLVYAALIAFGIYVLWVCFALIFSYQRKFYKNSTKLYNFLRKSANNSLLIDSVDKYASRISSGFLHGWRKFKREGNGKPSEYIKRREVLDVEVNGGVLNQGKSFMRAYIWLVVLLSFVFNLAFLGNSQTITCYILAESMVLPLVLLFALKIFYFLYTVIKQQLYKSDVEVFYDTIDLLDASFGGVEGVRVANQRVVFDNDETLASTQTKEESKQEADEQAEVKETENAALEENKEPEENEVEETNPLDRFDVFKKKNIDVSKLMNETPKSSSSLPYINVDSDYVIKDDGVDAVIKKPLANANNGSEILGGIMQDMSSIKKSSNFIDVDKPIAKIDEEKIDELTKESKEEPKQEVKLEDPFDSLSSFEVKNDVAETPAKEETQETNPSDSIPSVEAKDEILPETDETPKTEEGKIQTEPETKDEVSDEQKQELASIVDSFKPKKSTLASGGMVIERNERITRRERPVSEPQQTYVEEQNENLYDDNSNDFTQDEINHLSTNDNADTVLNSLHGFGTTGNGYNNNYEPQYVEPQQNQFATQPTFGQDYGYQPPYSQNNYMNQINTNFAGVQQTPVYGGYGTYQNDFNQTNYQNDYSQPQFDDYGENIEESEEIDDGEELRHLKPIINRTPAKKELRKSSVKVESKKAEKLAKSTPAKKETKVTKKIEKVVEEPMAKRGRPKKQIFDETLSIKNDQEFDEVLSRAEKLMRKSDEGLSQSQSKRIEKELKMLMDAMNRYKESK